jgi:putative transposase
VACRLLKVSRSGYYEWKDRPASAREQENELLLKHIEKIHADPKMRSYGSPRVHAELTLGLGMVVNEKRVARLMRVAGIQGLYRRRRRGCTVRDPNAEPATDLVNRQFQADAPNKLWLTDITEHLTDEGRLYCAGVLDVFSRKVVGWSMAEHMRKELVIDALGMALLRRAPQKRETILHSDHGSQGGFNWSSQHLDHGGVRWAGTRSWSGCPKGRGGSGRRTARCGRRCVRRVGLSRRALCSGSSGD